MQFKNIENLKNLGFIGFKPVNDLWNDHRIIPNEKGVYLVLNLSLEKIFLNKGVGGFFKQRDPNVSIEELEKKWVSDSIVVYIGQTGGNGSSGVLRKRVKQYLDFGKGKPIGHYGGRHIWQLSNYADLVFAWKVLENEDPKNIERKLIQDFIKEHGKKPFANISS